MKLSTRLFALLLDNYDKMDMRMIHDVLHLGKV